MPDISREKLEQWRQARYADYVLGKHPDLCTSDDVWARGTAKAILDWLAMAISSGSLDADEPEKD